MGSCLAKLVIPLGLGGPTEAGWKGRAVRSQIPVEEGLPPGTGVSAAFLAQQDPRDAKL